MKLSHINNLAIIPITFTRWKLQVQVLYRPPTTSVNTRLSALYLWNASRIYPRNSHKKHYRNTTNAI